MHKFYALVAGLFLLLATSVFAQEHTLSPTKASKYTSIKIGPSLTSLAPQGGPWLGRQFGAHAGITYLTMQNNWLGIQAEAQYSLQGAKIEMGHIMFHYLNVPIVAKFFIDPSVSFQAGAYAGLLLYEHHDYDRYYSRPMVKDKDHGLVYGVTYGDEAKLTISLRHQVGLANVVHAKNQALQLSLAYCIGSK